MARRAWIDADLIIIYSSRKSELELESREEVTANKAGRKLELSEARRNVQLMKRSATPSSSARCTSPTRS